MMSVPVVKQAIPTSGGGTTGPVGGGPGAGPPSTQSPGKITTGPQPGTNILPKSANPGNPMVGSMGGHSVGQTGGIAQTLQNSSLMKQVPPTASSMPISMVANHTASTQSMVHQSLSGVGSAGTMAPLSLVQEHRSPPASVPQPTPPAAHNHPTPPIPTQRGSAPPAHSTAPPSVHPPQSGPSASPMLGSSIDKPKELIIGAKPTSNGVQIQKAGEASGGAQQQGRKVSDGPVSLVVNHSLPDAPGSMAVANVIPQQSQQTHSLAAPASGSNVPVSPIKPDAAVANHAASQPAKSGLASSAAVVNKVSPALSPVKDKVPSTPAKSGPSTAAPKVQTPSATEANDVPTKSASPAPSSALQSTTSQAMTVKAPAATAGASPAKPSTPATVAATAAVPAASTVPSEPAAGSSQSTGASEASMAASASPAKPVATPTLVTEEPKVNNITSSGPAKTATENQNVDVKATTRTDSESATPTGSDKEGKANTPPSATPSRGSKRKRAEVKPPAPTLGSSQAAAIAAASRTPSTKNKSQSDIGSAKKDGGGEEDDDEERKPKRVRIRTQPYQSPLPELAYLPKFTRTPTTKAQEDKLILFYKNEFLAVRNAEGGFYVCQTMQNIYKHSARIRIRWLSQDTTAPKSDEEKEQKTNDGEVYSPDFYDLTDFDCILTNLNLDRLERGKYRLPNVELERTQSILKRALDAEKGLGQKTPLTEEHPDGLDLSLYRDESQLKKRRSPRRKGGPGKAKSSEGFKGKQEDGEDKESSSSSSSSSEDEATEADESSVKKAKREKRAPEQQQPPKEPSTPTTPTRARGGREAGKRKAESSEGKAKATPSAVPSKKRNNSSTPVRKRRSEAPTVAAPATPATPPARATPARATRSPKSAPAPSRKERSRVKEARKKPGKKA